MKRRFTLNVRNFRSSGDDFYRFMMIIPILAFQKCSEVDAKYSNAHCETCASLHAGN